MTATCDKYLQLGTDLVLYRPGLPAAPVPQEAVVAVAPGRVVLMLCWRSQGETYFRPLPEHDSGGNPIRQDDADPDAFPRLMGVVIGYLAQTAA